MPGVSRQFSPTTDTSAQRNAYGPQFSDLLRRDHSGFIEHDIVMMNPASVRAMAQLPSVRNDPNGLLRHIIGDGDDGDPGLAFQLADRNGLVELAKCLGELDHADNSTRSDLEVLGRAAAAHFQTTALVGVDRAMVRAFDNARAAVPDAPSGAHGSSDGSAAEALAAHALAGNVGSVKGPGMLEAPTVSEAVMARMHDANEKVAVALARVLGDGGASPVVASILTLKQFAQLLPTLSDEANAGLKRWLGLAGLTDKKIAAGLDAYLARLMKDLPEDIAVGLTDLLAVSGDSPQGHDVETNVRKSNNAKRQIDFADPLTIGFVDALLFRVTHEQCEGLGVSEAFLTRVRDIFPAQGWAFDLQAEAENLARRFNKTTLFHAWLGEYRPDAQEIRLRERPFIGNAVSHLTKKQLGQLGQELMRRAESVNSFIHLGLSRPRLIAIAEIVLRFAAATSPEARAALLVDGRAEYYRENPIPPRYEVQPGE